MATKNLTMADFESTIVGNDIVLVYSQPGALPAPALEDLITRIEALDMAEIHNQVAEPRAASRS
ncbi:hypothetical protein [Rhodococcus sp. B50]|uniref:hypothetical protein n=1 Tax=Rhodococcus sp. B50 TaxID=2682847 RepID=UPI0019FD3B47|nr:hypothetical protein [Rhodococcus sp. B50]MBS9373743.1 hypothetical protein [Rhodococcus sp. B50]